MFYALVVDLSGAPQELIDPDEGTVTGWGYVSSNPVLWLTRTNSKYAPNYLSLVSGMIGEADSMMNSDEKPTGHFNVVAMIDKVICTSFRVLGIPRIQRIILD